VTQPTAVHARTTCLGNGAENSACPILITFNVSHERIAAANQAYEPSLLKTSFEPSCRTPDCFIRPLLNN
jgi:hypothetical protein